MRRRDAIWLVMLPIADDSQ